MSTSETLVLPAAVRPTKYALRLEPDLDQFTFWGEESIAVDVVETTSEIVLNAIELQVESAALTKDGTTISAKAIHLDTSRETVTLDFGQAIAPGQGDLAVTFTGILNDKLRGFYRSQYTTPEGDQRYLAATQFEATDARRAFPLLGRASLQGHFRGYPDNTFEVKSNIQYSGSHGVPATAWNY